MGQSNLTWFLKTDTDIPGTATEEGFEKQIPIHPPSWSVSRYFSHEESGATGNDSTNRCQVAPVGFALKDFHTSTISLITQALKGETFNLCTITGALTTKQGKYEPRIEIKLTQAAIELFQFSGTSCNLALHYEKINIKHTARAHKDGAGGGNGEAEFDCVKGR